MHQIKNESGAKVKADKTGLYKKWKERSHQRISLGGMEKDNLQEGGLAGNAIHYFWLIVNTYWFVNHKTNNIQSRNGDYLMV